jgi:hypothetical protein
MVCGAAVALMGIVGFVAELCPGSPPRRGTQTVGATPMRVSRLSHSDERCNLQVCIESQYREIVPAPAEPNASDYWAGL